MTTPTQYGTSDTAVSSRPAATSWGTRYRPAITTTTTAQNRRSRVEPSRASANPGTVSAPERRIGAATSASISR